MYVYTHMQRNMYFLTYKAFWKLFGFAAEIEYGK